MKQFKYIKSNAFTTGESYGNPAACVFTSDEALTPEQMQTIAAEHKGFVMETVFCSESKEHCCKLTYYSSECEVDFCGHGTIATMYSVVKDSPSLLNERVISVETNKKGVISVYNDIESDDAIYIEAPSPFEFPVDISREQIESQLMLEKGSTDSSLPLRLIDAGLRTLIVPVRHLADEISVFPCESSLRAFCLTNNIDIILIFCREVADNANFAHTRVFAPKFGYLEDPATGSGNSAFANYLLSEKLWNGSPISIEQGGNDRVFNLVRLKLHEGKVLFGGKATKKIEGNYFI